MAESLPLYIVLVTGIPEIFLSLLLGFRLFNDTFNPKYALLISIIASCVNYIVRHWGVIFGIHTMFTTATIIIMCFALTQKNIWKITSATVTGIVLLLFIEVIEVLVGRFLNLNIAPLTGKLLMAFFKIVFMSAALVIVRKKNFSLFNSAFFE
jgi:hypothetical protein